MMPDAFIAASICVLAIFWSCWKFCGDLHFQDPATRFWAWVGANLIAIFMIVFIYSVIRG